MKSKSVSEKTLESASQSAKEAFATKSELLLKRDVGAAPVQQQGRRRLTDAYLIDIEQIVPDPDQPRKEFGKKELSELQASIAERGIKQPLSVRWDDQQGKYVVIDGGRRYQAAQAAKITGLPCWVQNVNGQDVLIEQVVHNWQRSNLKPYETADALVRLREEFGLTNSDLIRVTGKSKGEISKLLALRDKVVPEVQDMVRRDQEGKLTKEHAYGISKLKPGEQKGVADKVVDEGLTARQTEKLVASKSPKQNIAVKKGIAQRQKRIKTSRADVLLTFRKVSFSDDDVRIVVGELVEQLAIT